MACVLHAAHPFPAVHASFTVQADKGCDHHVLSRDLYHHVRAPGHVVHHARLILQLQRLWGLLPFMQARSARFRGEQVGATASCQVPACSVIALKRRAGSPSCWPCCLQAWDTASTSSGVSWSR